MRESVLTKNQKKVFVGGKGDHYVVATVRYDDQCGNGHNTFAITGEVYGRNGSPRDGVVKFNGHTLSMESCGCVHEAIAKYIPKLAPYIKWHLCDSDMPMHYHANVIFFAGDRDCWGLRKGEKKPLKHRDSEKPFLEWVQKDTDETIHGLPDADKYSMDDEITLIARQCYKVGDGKAREFDNARSAAIWPDATDEELSVEPEELKRVLDARLPKLMEEFCQAVESLGFTF